MSRARVLRERGIYAGHRGREHQLNVDFSDACADGEHRVTLAWLNVDGLLEDLALLELCGGDIAFTVHSGCLLLREEK